MIMGADLRELQWVVERLNFDYAEVLDSGDIERWPDFFTEDAIYRVTSKENADGNFTAGLIYCDGMGMLKDRAFALAHTETFAPRYTQHHVNNVRILAVEEDLDTPPLVCGGLRLRSSGRQRSIEGDNQCGCEP